MYVSEYKEREGCLTAYGFPDDLNGIFKGMV